MQVSVVDAKTGKVVLALDPTTGPVADPMVAIGALRERLLGSIVSGDLARKVTVASTPPKYSAYLEHYGGLREYVKNDMAASVPYFERAIALDSTYVWAYRFLISADARQGHVDEADRRAFAATARASVVLPTWRGPRSTTAGESRRRAATVRSRRRSIMAGNQTS